MSRLNKNESPTMKAQKQKGLFLGANHRFLGYNSGNHTLQT